MSYAAKNLAGVVREFHDGHELYGVVPEMCDADKDVFKKVFVGVGYPELSG